MSFRGKEDCPYVYSLPEGEHGDCPIKDAFVMKVQDNQRRCKAKQQEVASLKERVDDLEGQVEWWQEEVARMVAKLAEEGISFQGGV